MEFIKKPIVIEAFQMTQEARTDNSEWPNWAHEAWNRETRSPGSMYPVNYPHSDGTDPVMIWTLEGEHQVSIGDWVIRGVEGELYPCKPDIFEKTYAKH